MESQPQNAEFRIKSENFQPYREQHKYEASKIQVNPNHWVFIILLYIEEKSQQLKI